MASGSCLLLGVCSSQPHTSSNHLCLLLWTSVEGPQARSPYPKSQAEEQGPRPERKSGRRQACDRPGPVHHALIPGFRARPLSSYLESLMTISCFKRKIIFHFTFIQNKLSSRVEFHDALQTAGDLEVIGKWQCIRPFCSLSPIGQVISLRHG